MDQTQVLQLSIIYSLLPVSVLEENLMSISTGLVTFLEKITNFQYEPGKHSYIIITTQPHC